MPTRRRHAPAHTAKQLLRIQELFPALIYVPFAIVFWHAAPLATWQKMGLFKAIFYSFLAARHCGKAFLAYAHSWIVVGIALPAIISALLELILGKAVVAVMLLMPLSVILTIVMYCSLYSTYLEVFEQPEQNQS